MVNRFLNGVARGPERRNGFVLMVYPFRDPARCHYLTNSARHDEIVNLLREQVERLSKAAE